MHHGKTAILASVSLLLALLAPQAQAARACEYFTGPDVPVNFAPDPATGFIVLTLPIEIRSKTFTVDVQAAILGFLETGQNGAPTRALQTQTWDFRETGLRLEWNGDTRATPTDEPWVLDYTLRFDLAAANGRSMRGRRISTGVAYANGQINLLNLTGNTAEVFGRVCFK